MISCSGTLASRTIADEALTDSDKDSSYTEAEGHTFFYSVDRIGIFVVHTLEPVIILYCSTKMNAIEIFFRNYIACSGFRGATVVN
jgi:hypothetical protein